MCFQILSALSTHCRLHLEHLLHNTNFPGRDCWFKNIDLKEPHAHCCIPSSWDRKPWNAREMEVLLLSPASWVDQQIPLRSLPPIFLLLRRVNISHNGYHLAVHYHVYRLPTCIYPLQLDIDLFI